MIFVARAQGSADTMVNNMGCGGREKTGVPALPFTSSLILGKSFHLSVPQFPNLSNGDNNSSNTS